MLGVLTNGPTERTLASARDMMDYLELLPFVFSPCRCIIVELSVQDVYVCTLRPNDQCTYVNAHYQSKCRRARPGTLVILALRAAAGMRRSTLGFNVRSSLCLSPSASAHGCVNKRTSSKLSILPDLKYDDPQKTCHRVRRGRTGLSLCRAWTTRAWHRSRILRSTNAMLENGIYACLEMCHRQKEKRKKGSSSRQRWL